MQDDSDRMPTRRLLSRRPAKANGASTSYSITRKAEKADAAAKLPVSVTAHGNELEIHIHGQTQRLSKADGRRLLAALLETIG